MSGKTAAPYGSWKSPVTSDMIVSATVGLGQIALDGADVYWGELRPSEGGRVALVRHMPDGLMVDVIASPFNVRTRVHEYGGGAFAVADGTIYFSNYDDQRLYRLADGATPEPLTPPVDLRYADVVVDRARSRLIVVREDHTAPGREAVNTIVSLDLTGERTNAPDEERGGGRILVSGSDFYASPRISPDGRRLAWLAWNHPNMAWDGCELWVGEFGADGSLERTRKISGDIDESVFQPEWSPDGTLYFVSDRSGWWNLYRADEAGVVEHLYAMEAEFGRPLWVFGLTTYAFESAARVICTYSQRGTWHLATIDTSSGELQNIETPYSDITFLNALDGRAVFLGGSPTERMAVVEFDLETRDFRTLRYASETVIDPGYLSEPEAIEYPTTGGQTAHAIFYPPKNPDYAAPSGERPPLLVKCHGGPTSATSTSLRMEIQYWTSRGIAVMDVNYGGSSGYGREYRQRLQGQWGIVDIDDCVNGARYLAERGEIDGYRCTITGGSAGGYTVLAALTFHDFFKAGASHFGVSDLTALARETHKFESRYLDGLLGPYPERADIYHARSPINFTERLSCPVIFFQGLEDKVVPPNQAESMVEALRAKGLPVAYVPFEGEQHGFRRAENIKRSLDGELYFYSRVFGFELAEAVAPVPIDNL